MSDSTKAHTHKNGLANTIGLICGAIVYFGGSVLFPASSQFASDRGPRMITMMIVAGVVAGLVTLSISLMNSKKV